MKVCVLGSGSGGNSTYLEIGQNKLLIDFGLSLSDIELKLKSLNVDINEITGIFITHTHVDHVMGLKSFLKKYKVPVYLTVNMQKTLSYVDNFIYLTKELYLNDLKVIIIKSSHDVECVGYIFEELGNSLVYITDTGYINYRYNDLLKNRKIYIMESNHDVEMLMNNPVYPYYLKQRILGDKGHLSNKQSSEYLSKYIGSDTKYIFLAHLSEKNNTKDIALNNMKSKIDNVEIIVTDQNEKTELIEI